jgi:hypothetical protein
VVFVVVMLGQTAPMRLWWSGLGGVAPPARCYWCAVVLIVSCVHLPRVGVAFLFWVLPIDHFCSGCSLSTRWCLLVTSCYNWVGCNGVRPKLSTFLMWNVPYLKNKNSFEKPVTKKLAMRLAPFMDILVMPNQSVFIKGRALHDNFRTAHLIAKLLHACQLPSALLKIDIAKAFDSVRWPFLLELLRHLGFSGH